MAPELSFERIDSNGTLDIFSDNRTARFRIINNGNKGVVVAFRTTNNWRLMSGDGNSISYTCIFKGSNGSKTEVNESSNSVTVDKDEFINSVVECEASFEPTEKNPKPGTHGDKVIISVSAML